MKNELINQIKEISKQVRLPGVKRYLVEEIKEANMKNLSYEEFLYNLLLKESDLRLESGKKNMNQAGQFSLPEIPGGAID